MQGDSDLERLRSLVIGSVGVNDHHVKTVNTYTQFASLYAYPVIL